MLEFLMMLAVMALVFATASVTVALIAVGVIKASRSILGRA